MPNPMFFESSFRNLFRKCLFDFQFDQSSFGIIALPLIIFLLMGFSIQLLLPTIPQSHSLKSINPFENQKVFHFLIPDPPNISNLLTHNFPECLYANPFSVT